MLNGFRLKWIWLFIGVCALCRCGTKKLTLDFNHHENFFDNERRLDTVLKIKSLRFLEIKNIDFGGKLLNFYKLRNLNTLKIIDCGIQKKEHMSNYTILDNIAEDLTQLKFLDLSANRIEEVPIKISNLKKLKFLSLAHNIYLDSLPYSFGELYNLNILKLNSNRLASLPNSFGNLYNLKDLNIFDNRFKTFPISILQLKKLKKLVISYNRFDSIPNNINQLTNLEVLFIGSDSLTFVPASISKLKKLSDLNLNLTPKLCSIPEAIGKMPSLRQLRINQSNIEIPKTLFKNTRITGLYAAYNPNCQQEKLKEICTIKNLKRLDLSGNKIDSIPSFFSNLEHLEALNLGENRLTNFPNALQYLKKLKILELGNIKYSDREFIMEEFRVFDYNKISEIPNWINNLTKLQELHLFRCRLEKISPNIAQLKKLKYLDIHGNIVENLPVEISELKSLNYLDISNNKISQLPENIHHLQNLEKLYISGNPITELPANIVKLKKLKNLSLRETKIAELPTGFEKWTKLEQIYLSENQWQIKKQVEEKLPNCKISVY